MIEHPSLRWNTGAPCPLVVTSEARALFSFETPAGEVQTAEFVGCTAVRFGFPNDEVLHGHPLYGAGLQFYAAHQIAGSPWLAELRQIEALHRRAPAVPFADSRHYLLAFHDSTLEAIALDIEIGQRFATSADALAAMATAVAV